MHSAASSAGNFPNDDSFQSAGIARGALWDAVFENDELYPSLASMNSGSCSGSSSRPSHTEDGDALLNELRGSQLWHRPQAIDLIEAGSDEWEQLSQVHVLLFSTGAGDSQEGIYSLRATAGQDGLPRETVIVFEDCEDAVRYANLLEDAMPHLPQVCTLSAEELVSFCLERGYGCRLERTGTLLMPPILSVGMTDWELSNRLRSGAFSVLEADPPTAASLPLPPSSSSSSSDLAGGPLGTSAPEGRQLQQEQEEEADDADELQPVQLELELSPMMDCAPSSSASSSSSSCSPSHAPLSFVDFGESDHHMVGIDDDMHLHLLSTDSFDDLETIKSRLESLWASHPPSDNK